MTGLPEQAGLFDPFLSSRDHSKLVWPRDEDVERFQDHITKNQYSHTILVGSSGTGKSVFLDRIVRPLYENSFVFTDRYNNFLSTLINKIPCDHADNGRRTELAQQLVTYISEAKPQYIHDALRDRDEYPDAGLVSLVNETAAFIESCLKSKPLTLFVFDQIERFVTDFRYSATHNRKDQVANEIFCLIKLLKTLRKLPNIRTIFAIRKDTLFDSIDFLSYSLDAPNDSDRIFKYFYFTGITARNGRAINQIMESFSRVGRDRNIYTWDKIERFLTLSSRSLSNTFLTQLTGYMIEHFGNTAEVKDIIRHGEPRQFLPIFFDQLIAGFYKQKAATVSYNILRLTMLTVAIENRETGDPISETRASGLAHLPKADVEIALQYLRKVGIVRPDAAGEDEALRYAHDMLFDYIAESDSFTVRNDLHNVIERLSERRTPTKQLTPVISFGRVWRDAQRYDIGAIAVALYIIYIAVISFSAMGFDIGGYSVKPACELVASFWTQIWARYTYVETCDSLRWHHPAIYLMNALWVSYIYKLDRGYLRYVLNSRQPAKFIARMLPVLGVALGFLMSFTPIFSMVPLETVGIVMASLLLYIGGTIAPDSIFAKTNWNWGVRTFLNMLFSTLFLLLHWFMVTEDPLCEAVRNSWDAWIQSTVPLARYVPDIMNVKSISFIATGGFFIWFLFHIRPEQQNKVSLATRLAEFDAAQRRVI